MSFGRFSLGSFFSSKALLYVVTAFVIGSGCNANGNRNPCNVIEVEVEKNASAEGLCILYMYEGLGGSESAVAGPWHINGSSGKALLIEPSWLGSENAVYRLKAICENTGATFSSEYTMFEKNNQQFVAPICETGDALFPVTETCDPIVVNVSSTAPPGVKVHRRHIQLRHQPMTSIEDSSSNRHFKHRYAHSDGFAPGKTQVCPAIGTVDSSRRGEVADSKVRHMVEANEVETWSVLLGGMSWNTCWVVLLGHVILMIYLSILAGKIEA